MKVEKTTTKNPPVPISCRLEVLTVVHSPPDLSPLSLSPYLSPVAHSTIHAPATLAFPCARQNPTSGPLYLLFPLPGMLFQVCTVQYSSWELPVT